MKRLCFLQPPNQRTSAAQRLPQRGCGALQPAAVLPFSLTCPRSCCFTFSWVGSGSTWGMWGWGAREKKSQGRGGSKGSRLRRALCYNALTSAGDVRRQSIPDRRHTFGESVCARQRARPVASTLNICKCIYLGFNNQYFGGAPAYSRSTSCCFLRSFRARRPVHTCPHCSLTRPRKKGRGDVNLCFLSRGGKELERIQKE